MVGAGAVVGAICVYGALAFQPAIERWLLEPADVRDQAARLKLFIVAVALATALPLVGFAAYLWRLGARVLRDERFPPVGLAVIRPTPVLRGRQAYRRGRAIQALGVLLAIAAVAMGVIWWRLTQAI